EHRPLLRRGRRTGESSSLLVVAWPRCLQSRNHLPQRLKAIRVWRASRHDDRHERGRWWNETPLTVKEERGVDGLQPCDVAAWSRPAQIRGRRNRQRKRGNERRCLDGNRLGESTNRGWRNGRLLLSDEMQRR